MTVQPAKRDASRSPYERLRLQGTIRAAIIGYGVTGLSVLLARGESAGSASLPRHVLYLLATGLALQAALFVLRALTARYERTHGFEGYLSPLVVYIFELVVDSVTVFLFVWATYRGLLAFQSDL